MQKLVNVKMQKSKTFRQKLELQKVQNALQKLLSIYNSVKTSCKLILLITNHPILTMVKLVLKNQNTYLKTKMVILGALRVSQTMMISIFGLCWGLEMSLKNGTQYQKV